MSGEVYHANTAIPQSSGQIMIHIGTHVHGDKLFLVFDGENKGGHTLAWVKGGQKNDEALVTVGWRDINITYMALEGTLEMHETDESETGKLYYDADREEIQRVQEIHDGEAETKQKEEEEEEQPDILFKGRELAS